MNFTNGVVIMKRHATVSLAAFLLAALAPYGFEHGLAGPPNAEAAPALAAAVNADGGMKTTPKSEPTVVCPVLTFDQECRGPAGSPPCASTTTYDGWVVLPPGSTAADVPAVESEISDLYNCSFRDLVDGADGRIALATAYCQGGRSLRWTYEECFVAEPQ